MPKTGTVAWYKAQLEDERASHRHTISEKNRIKETVAEAERTIVTHLLKYMPGLDEKTDLLTTIDLLTRMHDGNTESDKQKTGEIERLQNIAKQSQIEVINLKIRFADFMLKAGEPQNAQKG